MSLFRENLKEEDIRNHNIRESSRCNDNYCQYHSAHDVRIQRVEDDVYKLTSTIDKFRNNILIMVINTFIQICIVLLQFVITAKDKIGQ